MADGNAWHINNRVNLHANQDTNSVYYIHPSDSSSQLVSVKFNGVGFSNWKRVMMLSLSAKNKIGFVNGTITKPAANSPDLNDWERCNDLVCSWLLTSLDNNIAKSVSREIWSDLEDRFGYASVAEIYALEQQLTELNQGSKSVSEFFTEIKTL